MRKIFVIACPVTFNYFATNEKEFFISAGADCKVKIWTMKETFEEVKILADSASPVRCLDSMVCQRTNFDKLLLTGSEDNTVRIYLTAKEFSLMQKIVCEDAFRIRAFAVFPVSWPGEQQGVVALMEKDVEGNGEGNEDGV